jgi:hypothetical protein
MIVIRASDRKPDPVPRLKLPGDRQQITRAVSGSGIGVDGPSKVPLACLNYAPAFNWW